MNHLTDPAIASPIQGKYREWSVPSLATALFVLIFTLLVFLPACWCGFVNWDDGDYANNSFIAEGLSVSSVTTSLLTFINFNWAPLTTISYLFDATLYGPHAFGFHLTNVVLHALTAACLYIALSRMTQAPTYSAAAVLLYAVHPLRVEPVVWISGRKDVLAAFLLSLVLLAYERHCRRPSPVGFMAVAGLMFGGLLAKATMVVVPALLLLVDVWPLERIRIPWAAQTHSHGINLPGSGYPAIKLSTILLEKFLLALLAAPFIVVSGIAQGEALASEQQMPFYNVRLPNGLYSLGRYVGMTFWPVGVRAFYSFPAQGPITWAYVITGICGAIALGMVICLCWARLRPVSVGLLWYVVALLPVLQIVKQIGSHSHADRYTHVPHIGLAVAVAWGVPHLARRSRLSERWLSMVLGLAILTCVIVDQRLIGFWVSSETLWERVLRYEPDNDLAGGVLAMEFAERGDLDRAIELADRVAEVHAGTRIYADLAELRSRNGCLDDAADICLREVAVKQAHHDGESPDVLEAIGRLVVSLRNRQDPRAGQLARDLEPAMRRVLGVGHVATLRLLVGLANDAHHSNLPDIAERYCREILKVVDASKERPPEIASAAALTLAESLERRGLVEEADCVMDRAVKQLADTRFHRCGPYAQVVVVHAARLASRGRQPEALSLVLPIIPLLRQQLGESHRTTRMAEALLADLQRSKVAD